MYIHLNQKERARSIYRVTSPDRLFEIFRTRRNVLVKPKLWDDPYENFILQQKVRHRCGEVRSYNYHDSIYGQCWTLHRASDAMWRIYAPEGNGIRIRSRIATLEKGLAEAHPDIAEAQCCIGRVQYLTAKKLREVANRTFDDYGIGVTELFNSTLVKRLAFGHEREVRLLYFQTDEDQSHVDLYAYEVDPHEMIDQIMVDPRLPRARAEALMKKIREVTGFRGPVLRSLLYEAPKPAVLEVSEWGP